MKEKSAKETVLRTELTEREKDVARLLVEGMSNKEIGTRLGITEKTVKFHLTSIFKHTSNEQDRKDRKFIANYWKTGNFFFPYRVGK